MTQQQTEADPFAPSAEKRPSVSFKDKPIGTSYTLEVQSVPKLVQARDFETGQPAFWPDQNPKMTAVLDVVDTSTGQELALWAAKPSALFKAIQDAQLHAAQQIQPGGKLVVSYIGDKPNENPRLNAAKQYSAVYTPPNVFGGALGSERDTAPQGWGAGQTPPPMQPTLPSQGSTIGVNTLPQPAQQNGPTRESVAAIIAAGMDPAQVWPGVDLTAFQ